MRGFVRSLLLLLLSAVLMVSCFDEVEPGSFSLVLEWEDTPPENLSELYAWGYVKQDGLQVAESAITQIGAGVDLAFPRVPNGDGLVLVVEIKKEAERESGTLYFGQSEPFTLEAGKHVDVKVALKLQATPLAQDGDSDTELEAGLRIVDASGSDIAYTNSIKVRLLIQPVEKTAQILVSNDIAFPEGGFELKDIENAAEYSWQDWALCADKSTCTEGVHRVYAKFRDAYGYDSDVFVAQVTYDIGAPELANAGDAVSPRYANAQSTVTAVVTPTEPLGDAPVLHVEPNDPGFVMDANPVGESYIFRYLADDNATDGQLYRLTVDIADEAGNRSHSLELGVFTIDRTAPGLELVSLTPERLGALDGVNTLELVFTVDEELSAQPAVTVGKEGMEISASDGLTYTCSYTTNGNEKEGPQLLRVQLSDLAGNSSAVNLPQQVEFDFSAPKLISGSASPTYAKLGSQLALTAKLNETLAEGTEPELQTELGGWLQPEYDAESLTWIWRRTVQETDANNSYSVSIKGLSDELGNSMPDGESYSLGAIRIDSIPPQAVGLALTPPDGKVKAGDVVRLSFLLNDDEVLATGYPKAYFGSPDTPMTPKVNDEAGYTFEYEVKAEESGPATVSVELLDEAGNPAAVIAGTLDVDNTGPQMEIEITPQTSADSPAPLGQLLSVTVTANEKLNTGSIIFNGGGVAFVEPLQLGPLSNTWKYKVTAADDGGPFTVSFTASDTAGNPAQQAATAQFYMDGVRPKIEIVDDLRQELIEDKLYRFSLGFTVTDNALNDLTVLLTNEGTFSQDMGALEVGGGTTYNYVIDIDARETDVQSSPLFTARITASDKAGNQATEFSNTVQLDTQAPELVGFEVTPSYAKIDDIVRVILTANQMMQSAPNLAALCDETEILFSATEKRRGRGGISYVYEGKVPANADEGHYTFSQVVLMDEAGNISLNIDPLSVNPKAYFIVDSSAPVIVQDGAYPLKVSREVVASGMEFSVSFNIVETSPLQGTPLLRVGGRLMTAKAQSDANYAYTYTYTPHKNAPDTHGLKEISINVSDRAGNAASASASIEFDFNAPRIVSSICTPAAPEIIPLGGVVTCRATFDEMPQDGCSLYSYGRETTVSKNIDFGMPVNCETGDLTLTWRHTANAWEVQTGPGQLEIRSDSGRFRAGLHSVSDALGNSSNDLEFGQEFEIDADKPALSGVEISGGYILQNGLHRFSDETGFKELKVEFDASDAYGTPAPEVEMETAAGPVSFTNCSNDDGHFSCVRSFTGAEGDGLRTVRINLRDTAGNSVNEQKQVECDFTPPSATPVSIAPFFRQNIVYNISVNEELGRQPAFTTLPYYPPYGYTIQQTGNRYSFQGDVVTSTGTPQGPYIMPNGLYYPILTICDLVDNCAELRDELPTFEIDWALPEISGLTVQGGGLIRPSGMHVFNSSGRNNETWISFRVDDDYGNYAVKVMVEAPGASVNGEISCQNVGNEYYCPQAFQGDGSGQGPVPGYEISCIESGIGRVIVTAEDEAGNRRSLSENIEIDMDAPRLVTETINTDMAKLNDDIIVRLTLNEAVNAAFQAPELTATGGGGKSIQFDLDSSQDETLMFRHTASAGESGIYELTLSDACDMLNNCGSAIPLENIFEIDADVPHISASVLSGGLVLENGLQRFSALEPFNLAQLTLTVEDEYGDFEVSVTMDSDNGEVTFGQGTGGDYQHYFSGDEGSTKHTVKIHVQDEAGNSDQTTLTLECDFDAPTVEDSHYTPDPAYLGSTIKYYINTDEKIETSASNLTISGDLGGWGAVSGSGVKFSWTRTGSVIAGEHGSHSVAIGRICDLVGNCDEDVSVSPIIVDAEAARVEDLKICFDDATDTPCTDETETFSAQDGFNLMKVSFNLSQEAETLVTSIGGDDLLCEPNGLTYVCHYTVIDEYNGTKPRMITELISINSIDDAGNSFFASQPVSFDFKPPFQTGTALLERCDGYSPAREAQDRLWVKNGNQCSGGDKNLCQYKGPGCPYRFNSNMYAPLRVSFALSEDAEIGAEGVHIAGGGLFTVDSASTGTYKTAYYAGFSDGPGTLPVIAHVVDALGNESSLSVATLRFDYGQPQPPDTDTEDNIIYTRVPYGSEETNGRRKYFVRVDLNKALEEAASAIIYDGPDVDIDSELGRITSGTANSPVEIEIPSGNNPEVYIAQEDRAGNSSSAALVRDVRWVATSGFKVAGSNYANQGYFETRREIGQFSNQKGESEAAEFGTEAGLSRVGGAFVSSEGNNRWRQLSLATNTPGCRLYHSMVFDPMRGRVILFGGTSWDCTIDSSATYEWDGHSWATVSSGGPTRSGHAMIYDPLRKHALVFGGGDDQTWELDGATWKRIMVSGPSSRSGHAMAYDAARKKAVMFGGGDNETWEWDGRLWAKITPSDPEGDGGPSARTEHAMAYDKSRGAVVLSGGSSGALLGDTWEWNGVSWKRISNSGPFIRSHAMVYDDEHQSLLLYGGTNADETSFPQTTWRLDGNTWVQAANTGPHGRMGLAMAYDQARQRVVLAGGWFERETELWDTWEWDGLAWSEVSASSPPSASTYATAYDMTRKRTIVFGANGTWGSDDTWEWDGTSWNMVADSGPSSRSRSAMAYDFVRNISILFGGLDTSMTCTGGSSRVCGDTWSWNGSSWVRVSTTGVSGRTSHAMAYDFNRQKIVLFGGFLGPFGSNVPVGDTWEWNGSAWTKKADWGSCSGCTVCAESTCPSPRYLHAMAFNPVSGKVLLTGGTDKGYETWEWNGSTWTLLSNAGHPGASSVTYMSMAYNTDFGALILAGGNASNSWKWTGSTWQTVNISNIGAMRYDAARKQAVVFNGSSTYELVGPDTSAGQISQFAFAVADAENPEFKKLDVKAISGGSASYGQRYLYVPSAVTWYTAREACEAMGAGTHLATISNATEQDAIARYLGIPVRVWIGLTDEAVEGTFVWIDATPMSYTHWVSGQPDNTGGAEDCGELLVQSGFTPLEWNDAPCNYRQGYLCELGPTEGSRLTVWDGLEWSSVAENYDSPGSPNIVEWNTDDGEYIESLLTGDEQYINFAITPLYPNGWGGIDSEFGKVTIDYLEATVKYRLPAEEE